MSNNVGSHKEPAERSDLLSRYFNCASQILALFQTDPLPPDDPAHSMIERLEAVLHHKLLQPALTVKSAGTPEKNWDGGHEFDGKGRFIDSKPIMMKVEEAQLRNMLNRAKEIAKPKVTYSEDETKMLKEALHDMLMKAELLAVEFETIIRRQG